MKSSSQTAPAEPFLTELVKLRPLSMSVTLNTLPLTRLVLFTVDTADIPLTVPYVGTWHVYYWAGDENSEKSIHRQLRRHFFRILSYSL